MRWSIAITLVAQTFAADTIGNQVATETEKTIFANEYALSRSEYYAASEAGLKPAREFQVHTVDYAGEELVRVGEYEYAVVRVEARGDYTRIVVEKKGRNA